MELVQGCATGACYSLYKGVLWKPAIACTSMCYGSLPQLVQGCAMELVPGRAMGACYSLYKGVLREPAIACTRVCYGSLL